MAKSNRSLHGGCENHRSSQAKWIPTNVSYIFPRSIDIFADCRGTDNIPDLKDDGAIENQGCTPSQEECDREFGGNWYYYFKS